LWSCQPKKLLATPGFVKLIPGKCVYFKNTTYIVKPGDTLPDIAVKLKVGYRNLFIANQKSIENPWVLTPGLRLIVPKELLIPCEVLKLARKYRRVLVVNLPEMRLYYFDHSNFFVAPIGVGIKHRLPPVGKYYILRKKKNPRWYPPPSIKRANPRLPKFIPPGPRNPLGKYALYLSRGFYAIHGTNKPYSIGRRSTHGCIRLYAKDIEFLFKHINPPVPVFIIYIPYKLCFEHHKIYLQVFPDMEHEVKYPVLWILDYIRTHLKHLSYNVDLIKLTKVLSSSDGKVYVIGTFNSRFSCSP